MANILGSTPATNWLRRRNASTIAALKKDEIRRRVIKHARRLPDAQKQAVVDAKLVAVNAEDLSAAACKKVP